MRDFSKGYGEMMTKFDTANSYLDFCGWPLITILRFCNIKKILLVVSRATAANDIQETLIDLSSFAG